MRCQYTHAESQVSIYVEASQKYIAPGLKLLSSLNSGLDVSGNDMEKKLIQLGGYYEVSLKGIRVFAKRLPVCSPTCAQRYRGILTSGPPRLMNSS